MRQAVVSALAALSVLAMARPAGAQQADEANARDDDGAYVSAWRPTIFAFALEQAGDRQLDPFAPSGRREMLQLMMGQGPFRGQFGRARINTNGAGDDFLSERGFYEIDGDRIMFWYMDANGRTARVEEGQYQRGRICLKDGDGLRALRFEYLREDQGAFQPPESPALPEECK